MEKKLKPLPLGNSTFKDIINSNCIYVDKTEEIYKLVEGQEKKYFFLSRPRRFGKSLLVSTLESIFAGEKELFKGLYIYDKIDFKKYPVIKLTMNDLIYSEGTDKFKESLLYHISRVYKEYKIELKTDNYILAFKQLIEELSKIDKVILLIDEYDKPITEYIDNIEKANEMRLILRSFYETIKANDSNIHFCFITGISKFSKVSIFSALNNLTDITMDKKYSKIIGIEEKDLYSYFADRITLLAQEKNVTEEELKIILKKMYNGYSWDGKNSLYNPYSLLLLFKNEEIKSYWFDTGTPSFVPKLIKQFDLDIKELDECVLKEEDFSFYEVDDMNPYALLFQAGYLTIKEIRQLDIKRRQYVLSYPNMEVKEAFLYAFLKEISYPNKKQGIFIDNMMEALEKRDLDKFFNNLKTVFNNIPNQIQPEKFTPFRSKEFYYHTVFQVVFFVIGTNIKSEISTAKGFIDSVIELDDKVYIFEFKMEKDPQIALSNPPSSPFTKGGRGDCNSYVGCGKEIILVGVSFDINERNITDWKEGKPI